MKRRFVAPGMAIFALALLAAPSDLDAEATFHRRGTALVDGIEGASEWTGAAAGSALLVLPGAFGGGSSMVEFLLMNDDDNLYVAVRLPYGISPPLGELLVLEVLALEAGLDSCAATNVFDYHALASSNNAQNYSDMFEPRFAGCDSGSPLPDESAGGSTNGWGMWGAGAGTTFFEVSNPLDTTDDAHDLNTAVTHRLFVQPMAAGCDTVDCGTPATIVRRIYLEPSNHVFLGDFESGSITEWSSAVP